MEVMMNTLEFFSGYCPRKGIVLGVPETNEHGRAWWKNRKFATIAEAASEAVKLDARQGSLCRDQLIWRLVQR